MFRGGGGGDARGGDIAGREQRAGLEAARGGSGGRAMRFDSDTKRVNDGRQGRRQIAVGQRRRGPWSGSQSSGCDWAAGDREQRALVFFFFFLVLRVSHVQRRFWLL